MLPVLFVATNMADSISQFSDGFDDEDDKEEFLALEIARTPVDHDYFRPSLADDQKIGFFSLDRACQTDVTEIINIKELTTNIDELLDDAAKMRRDINFARNVMQADFDSKLHQKAIELYVRVNDKISEIERNHEDRVATVRRAFKQQLADAIARMQTLYSRNMADKMKREKTKLGSENKRWQNKFHDMQATIQRNESIIHMLQMQLTGMQEKETAVEYQYEESVESVPKSPSVDYQGEIEHLREEMERTEEEIRSLEESIHKKDENNARLGREIQALNEDLEKARIMIEQLQHENGELQSQADQDKAYGRRQLENQRLAMEKELEERIRRAKEEALTEARQHLDDMSSVDRDKIKQLMEEKKQLELALANEKAKQKEKKKEVKETELSHSSEEKLLAEIAKLKKEIERVHKTWEKKFAILQQSLHALKDESYIRQTMQRQAAQLHQAAISFAYDQPMGIQPTGQSTKVNPHPPSNSKKPLPDIRSIKEDTADYISYTVSAPSGRATTVFSINDENQVMSDNEQDMPPDVVPLPSPPPHRLLDDDSRPSTRSHVVVMPAVKA